MSKSISFDTFAQCYEHTLRTLLENPEYVCSPRGMQIKEITDYSFVIKNPASCLYDNSRRSSQKKYIAGEFLWYFSGRRDLVFIERYASFWKQIADTDGNLNSAYGYLLFNRKNEYGKTQWQWAHDSLIADRDTRQAIMHFNTPNHQYDGNKDFVCTLTGIFQIRENKLNFTITMRSNDIILGTATDVAFFCVLQMQMHKLLKEKYPDLELGTYTHYAHSLHIYERHFTLAEEMLAEEFKPEELPYMVDNLVDSTGNATNFINGMTFLVATDFFDQGGTPADSLKNLSYYKDSLELWIEKNTTG